MTRDSGEKNWFEWAVFAAGLLLTLGVVGILVFEIVSTGERTPPAIEVRFGTAVKQAGHYAVPVSVENKGDETAEAVQIEATLKPQGDDEEEEKASFEVQFLPGHGKREGWVTFSSDPSAGRLEARSVGYEMP